MANLRSAYAEVTAKYLDTNAEVTGKDAITVTLTQRKANWQTKDVKIAGKNAADLVTPTGEATDNVVVTVTADGFVKFGDKVIE